MLDLGLLVEKNCHLLLLKRVKVMMMMTKKKKNQEEQMDALPIQVFSLNHFL
jgi:hypothetical protein